MLEECKLTFVGFVSSESGTLSSCMNTQSLKVPTTFLDDIIIIVQREKKREKEYVLLIIPLIL